MTEDLLERRIADAMERRAERSEPATGSFRDVEARAARHRRARTRGAGAAIAASVVLVVAAVVGVGGLRSDDRHLTVGPADDPSTTVVAPGPVGDRWLVLAGVEPTRADPPFGTISGPQPSTPGSQDVEIAPYVYVGERSERAVVYELTGERWTSTVTWTSLAASSFATATSVTGTGFDPGRFDEIENTSDLYTGLAPSSLPPEPDPSRGSDRPEQLLAAPDSHPVVLPVEHHGSFDWVLLPTRCTSGGAYCSTTAIGGDESRLLVIDFAVSQDFDLRAALAEVELRSADQLPITPPADPAGPIGVGNGPYVPPAAWGAAPFFQIRLPIVRDDSVWPADVPADYCTAFRQWKAIQVAHLGAFGSPGWIRWAGALGLLAPPELVDPWGVVVREQSAGRDTSATAPGNEALGIIVADGDARCPV